MKYCRHFHGSGCRGLLGSLGRLRLLLAVGLSLLLNTASTGGDPCARVGRILRNIIGRSLKLRRKLSIQKMDDPSNFFLLHCFINTSQMSFGLLSFYFGGLKLVRFLAKIEHTYILRGNYCILLIDIMSGPQKVSKLDFQRQFIYLQFSDILFSKITPNIC